MREPDSIQKFIEHDEQMNRHRINEDEWDLQQPLQPLKRVAAIAHIEEWGCECVQVDVDEWDARHCPEHGAYSPLYRGQQDQEAAELAAYYSVDPDLASRKPTASADSSTVGSNGIDIHETFSFNKKDIIL
jgi:hypothetical protein